MPKATHALQDHHITPDLMTIMNMFIEQDLEHERTTRNLIRHHLCTEIGCSGEVWAVQAHAGRVPLFARCPECEGWCEYHSHADSPQRLDYTMKPMPRFEWYRPMTQEECNIVNMNQLLRHGHEYLDVNALLNAAYLYECSDVYQREFLLAHCLIRRTLTIERHRELLHG